MNAQEQIRKKLDELVDEAPTLVQLCRDEDGMSEFSIKYQNWYSRALKIVSLLGVDRLEEFKNYYLIDPRRKELSSSNYVIQDFIKGVGAPRRYGGNPLWDTKTVAAVRVVNQYHILMSLSSRIDSVLSDVEGHMFAELQDDEIMAVEKIIKVSPRASGTLAGVLLERHLQRVVKNHGITIRKKSPTIADLNDPLKKADVYDISTWRKIQYLGDLRNLCSHNKSREPTIEEVEELISGVKHIIKTVF